MMIRFFFSLIRGYCFGCKKRNLLLEREISSYRQSSVVYSVMGVAFFRSGVFIPMNNRAFTKERQKFSYPKLNVPR